MDGLMISQFLILVLYISSIHAREKLLQEVPENENKAILAIEDKDKTQYMNANFKTSAYNFEYDVSNNGQFHHENRGPDGVTYGCYGHVEQNGVLRATHYVADSRGYRVVRPNQPVEVFANNNPGDGEKKDVRNLIPWNKLYFPKGCGKAFGTDHPSTLEPISHIPSTPEPTRYIPSTAEPKKYTPSTPEPKRYTLSTAEPKRYTPSTPEPKRYTPSTPEPNRHIEQVSTLPIPKVNKLNCTCKKGHVKNVPRQPGFPVQTDTLGFPVQPITNNPQPTIFNQALQVKTNQQYINRQPSQPSQSYQENYLGQATAPQISTIPVNPCQKIQLVQPSTPGFLSQTGFVNQRNVN